MQRFLVGRILPATILAALLLVGGLASSSPYVAVFLPGGRTGASIPAAGNANAAAADAPMKTTSASLPSSSLPLSPTPALLASAVRQDVRNRATSTGTAWRIVMAEYPNGFAWEVGNRTPHHNGEHATFIFNASNASSFSSFAALLTNGIDDPVEFLSGDQARGPANFTVANESAIFGTNPDLVGNAIDYVALVVANLHLVAAGGSTWEFANYTWQIWGHPIFVAFVPPTDPNGSFLFNRNSTSVRVHLAASGTAKLNWDGVNQTMLGSGQTWYRNETNLSNTVHSFSVWATDLSSVVHRSEVRQLEVAYQVWSSFDLNPGTGPSVATDANGTVHVCYEGPKGVVHYATKTTSGWSIQTVGFGGNGYCLLVLDKNGGPHLLFGSLAYATLNGATWTVQHISVANVTRGAALTISPVTLQPMVAYHDSDPRERYLVFKERFPNGTWNTQIIDKNGDTGWMPSLAVNSTGYPRIAYTNSAGNLLYAYSTGIAWTILNVDNITSLSGLGRISLAMGPGDSPHIAYAGGGPRYGTVGYSGLRYASWTGSAWTHVIVADGPALSVSLAFDVHGHPNIAYSLIGTPPPSSTLLRDLRYAAWNGSWTTQILSHSVNSSTVELSMSPAGVPQVVATSWCCGNNTTQGPVQFYTITIGIFATFHVTPDMGNLSTTFTFDPNGSWDTYFPSSRLEGRWDLSGNGVWTAWAALAAVHHAYSAGGIYNAFLQIRDPNATLSAEERTVIVDAWPPVTTATLTGTNGTAGWFRSPVQITLNATDNLTDVVSTSYSLDTGTWTPYGSPITVSSSGNHSIRFTSTNEVGNVEPDKTVAFGIDLSAPTTTAALSGTSGIGGWYASNVTVTLTASDPTSGVASIHERTDGGPWQTYGAPFVLSDGNHTLQYYSVDRAGNQGATSTSPVKVDTTSPIVLAQLSGTLGKAGWYTSSVTVRFTAADNLSGVAFISISTNGGSWRTFNSSLALVNLTADGAYSLTYFATDRAGNVATHHTISFNIDTTAPALSVHLAGTAGTNGWFTSAVTVTLNASDNASGVSSVTYTVDNSSWHTYSGPFVVGEGNHTVSYAGTDLAGNVASIRSTAVRVDTTPPVIRDVMPSGPVGTRDVTVTWSGSDSGSGIADYEISLDGGAFQSVGTATSHLISVSDGDHTVVVAAFDLAGNRAEATTKIHVDTNLFSFFGPYGPIPFVGIAMAVIIVFFLLLLLYWRRQERERLARQRDRRPNRRS